jgi:hypothetical protein
VEFCIYGYSGLEITFIDEQLILLDITDSQWRFPLGIRVGDSEQAVHQRLGQPRWQYEYEGQRQLDWDFTARLSIYIRAGKVSRIVWG